MSSSKQQKGTKWFVRVTAPHSHCEAKVKMLCESIDVKCAAIGYHIGAKTKKPHIHIAVEMLTELQKQSMDVRLKKLFEVKGADYSNKPWDGSLKALSYLYHDKDGTVVFHKMDLTESQMDEIRRTVDVYADIVHAAKEKASTRIPDKIVEMMGGEQWRIDQVVRRIYQGVRNKEWYDPGPMMDRYVREILLRSSGETDYVDYFTMQFIAKFDR